MPKPRASRLESATARRKLAAQKKPYWLIVSPNIGLGYRRNEGAGTWSVRVTGNAAAWTKKDRIGRRPRARRRQGRAELRQAIDAARALARFGTVAHRRLQAVDARRGDHTLREADLRSRGGDPYNAERARLHLTPALLSKPVSMLSPANELKRWRDPHLAEKCLSPRRSIGPRSASPPLALWAQKHDPRIESNRAWKVGLGETPHAHRARNGGVAAAGLEHRTASHELRDHPLFAARRRPPRVHGAPIRITVRE